jgi:hypothetical protein
MAVFEIPETAGQEGVGISYIYSPPELATSFFGE